MAGNREAGARWLSETSRVLLEGWARDGMTDAQIAEEVGVSRQELNALSEKFPEIAEAIRRGRDADNQVERALFEAAKSGDVRATAFVRSNCRRPGEGCI